MRRPLPVVPKAADAVIIGAGVIGASIAYHLTRHGIRPLVLEKAAGRRKLGACDGSCSCSRRNPVGT
jgi:glycine/D-amino acid oxidase-like deaminating enzyme